jgi:hypothetical protein
MALYPGASRFKKGNVRTLRATSGDLVAGETTTAIDCSDSEYATLVLTITDLVIESTGDTITFYFQTSYDDGTTYTDLEALQFGSGDSDTSTITKIVKLGPVAVTASDTAADNTDGSLTAGTKAAALGLGSRIRIKVAVSGITTGEFYNYDCYGYFR